MLNATQRVHEVDIFRWEHVDIYVVRCYYFQKCIICEHICIIILYSIKSVRNTRTFVFLECEAEWKWIEAEVHIYSLRLHCNFSIEVSRQTSHNRTRENMVLFIFVFKKYECLDVMAKYARSSRDMNMTDLWHLFCFLKS